MSEVNKNKERENEISNIDEFGTTSKKRYYH